MAEVVLLVVSSATSTRMSAFGGLIFAYEHWFRAKTNQNELVKDLRGRVLTLTKTEEGKQWVDALTEQYGELVAIKRLKMLRGLPDYPKQTFWAYVFKIGVPMELVVTRTHLLFFEPAFRPDAKMASVARSEIKWVAINSGDGSQLHVKTKSGFIRCQVGVSLDAKPIWRVIEEVLVGRKNVR